MGFFVSLGSKVAYTSERVVLDAYYLQLYNCEGNGVLKSFLVVYILGGYQCT